MSKATRIAGHIRTAMLILALALPVGSLVAFGALWLVEKDYVLGWAACAGLLAVAVYFFFYLLLKEATAGRRQKREQLKRSDPLWTEREVAAWDAVCTIADDVDPGRLNSRNAFLALGTRTVETVGETMFPGEDHPLWRFSVPELLVLTKRVSDALEPVVRDNIPHGDSLTIGQAMAIYQWRSVMGVTEAVHDLWHLTKPASDAGAETREDVSRRLGDWDRNELGRRLAAAYVRVVGRAAIDLYSGRLRNAMAAPPPRAAEAQQPTANGQAAAPQEVVIPLRILVAGQVAAGKSSLISALLRQIRARVDALPPSRGLRAYEFKRDGVAEALLVDSPGIEADDVAIEGLKTQAQHCDLLIWVTSAMGPERGRDRKVLEALRRAARAEGRHPPVLAVHTHVDQLTPILDWTPPYNLDRAESPKAQSIAKALLAVATDLRVPIQSVVPVCLDQMRGTYNVDVLWAKMLDALSEAQRARLGRALAVAGDDGYWKRLSTNANVTGRIVTRGPTSQKDDTSPATRFSRNA